MKMRNAEAKSESEQAQCWGENPNAQMLRIEKQDGSFQLYPYGWLECVQFSPAEDEDKLIMIFGDREIHITGIKMRLLGFALQEATVEWIKELPDRFVSIGNDKTRIEKIEFIIRKKEAH